MIPKGTCLSCGKPAWQPWRDSMSSFLCVECLSEESDIQGNGRDVENEMAVIVKTWPKLQRILNNGYSPWNDQIIGFDTWSLIMMKDGRVII